LTTGHLAFTSNSGAIEMPGMRYGPGHQSTPTSQIDHYPLHIFNSYFHLKFTRTFEVNRPQALPQLLLNIPACCHPQRELPSVETPKREAVSLKMMGLSSVF